MQSTELKKPDNSAIPQPLSQVRPGMMRVVLYKLLLQDFLCFDNAQVVFDEKLTVLTGPNGSGKSSVFQALKFVLGSNNYDQRYGRWRDFIRTGAQKTVVQAHIMIGEDEYLIQRSVTLEKPPQYRFKQPQDSEFKSVSAVVIQSFLVKAQINPDNLFSFMSQGQIDSIKDMKEEAICRLIEQGIGLVPLHDQIYGQKQKLDSLQIKIRALSTQRDSFQYQLRELTPKLRRLEEKHLIIDELNRCHDELLWVQKGEIEEEIRSHREEIKVLQQSYNSNSNDLEQFQTQLNDITLEIQQVQEKAQEKTNELRINEVRFNVLQGEINQWKADNTALAQQIEDISNKIITLKESILPLEKQLVGEKNKLQKLDQKLESIYLTQSQLEQEIHTIQSKFLQYQMQYTEYQTKLTTRDLKQQQLEITEKEHDETNQNLTKKMQEIQQIEHELNQFRWFLENRSSDLPDRMKSQMQQCEDEIQQSKSNMQQLQNQYNEMIETLERVKQIVHDRSLPKPKAIQAMMDEISERKLSCIGPIIDLISFDDFYQTCIESVFGNRSLYGFIAKDSDTFALLNNMAQRHHAYCNLYKERSDHIPSLPPLQVNDHEGILGYLLDKIHLLHPDLALQKVLYSIVHHTLIAKDHISAEAFLEKYHLDTWIVTLDGEQIRPKHLVLEARPFIRDVKHDGVQSVAQAKEKIQELTEKSEKNRLIYEQEKQEIDGKQNRVNLIAQRLGQIDELMRKYTYLEICTGMKNKAINQRTKLYSNIQNLHKDIETLEIDLDTLKHQFPEDLLEQQNRLTQISIDLHSLSEQISQYTPSRQQSNATVQDLETQCNKILFECQLQESEKQRIQTTIQQRDQIFFEKLQEYTRLQTCVDTIKKKIHEYKESIQQLELRSQEKKEIINQIRLNILKFQAQIDNLTHTIAEKEQKLSTLSQNLAKYITPITNKRTFAAIQADIFRLERALNLYRDVDDFLLSEKTRIEQYIAHIDENYKQIDEEITMAQSTQKDLEETYFSRFDSSLVTLQNVMNDQLTLTGLDYHVELKLYGDIHSLKLQINPYLRPFSKEEELTTRPFHALSGGQRSMIGITLMISLNHLNPSPLNIYDECSMFLDDLNAQSVATLIYNFAQSGIQFIILMPTLNPSFLACANQVVGFSYDKIAQHTTVHVARKRLTT